MKPCYHFFGPYLSSRHVNQDSFPCPIAFLTTDVANKYPKIVKSYTGVLEGFFYLKNNFPEDNVKSRQKLL